jgi:hypothetical protein
VEIALFVNGLRDHWKYSMLWRAACSLNADVALLEGLSSMKVWSKAFSLALALSVALASQAHAASLLDFGVIAPTTGSISFGGGTNPLKGINISVDNVTGLGTPLNGGLAGQRNCIGCLLNFTTGPATAGTWNFGSAGTTLITLIGGVDLNNNTILDAGDVPAGTTLLSGSFTGTTVVFPLSGGFRIAGAAFVDVKDSALAAFYGLPGGASNLYTGGFNLSFLATGTPFNAFSSSQVLSGDITNQPPQGTQREIDLPSSLLLLGSGLVGFAYLTARSKRS